MLNYIVNFIKSLNSNSKPSQIANSFCIGMILGFMPFMLDNPSTAVSYKPTIVPSAPEIRCNSSWIISSGERLFDSDAKNDPTLPSHAIIANLSTVPNNSVGGFMYNSSSIICIGRRFVKSQASCGQNI